MSFGIIRTKKITSFGAMVGVAMHNFREREVTNADEKKKDKNVYWRAKTHEELLLGARNILNTVDRKIQKNAVLGIEYLVTASPDFFDGITREDTLDFFQKSLGHLKRKHGTENVVSASIHFDEKTPHLHVVLIPVLKKEKKVTNPHTKETRTREVVSLDSGHWLGGREKMKKLQNDFFEEVSKKYGLERGNEGAKATHQDIARWYSKKHKEEAEGRLTPPTPLREKIAGGIPSPTIPTEPVETDKNEEKKLEDIMPRKILGPEPDDPKIGFGQDQLERYGVPNYEITDLDLATCEQIAREIDRETRAGHPPHDTLEFIMSRAIDRRQGFQVYHMLCQEADNEGSLSHTKKNFGNFEYFPRKLSLFGLVEVFRKVELLEKEGIPKTVENSRDEDRGR